ncbi:MAG: four helix bundle protein [Bacteroidales bacterium]|nr:four helix bundle protein [Bacteroidales bacterium]MCB8999210.1 four helix bundle protein [Bacteroidales bacterium]
MFDFENLPVYKKAKQFNSAISHYIRKSKLDLTSKDQLRRASFSIVLNIAEGSGRFSKADRSNFFIISRSSIFECIAILDILKEEGSLMIDDYEEFYKCAEELSRILFSMIRNLTKAD